MRRPLRRAAALAAAVAILAAGCSSSSVAGLYGSEDGTKTLELAEDGRFAFDFGHALAELGSGSALVVGRYEIAGQRIKLFHRGRVVITLRVEGDHLVMEDGTVLVRSDAPVH